MGRMHAPGKGISDSGEPVLPALWLGRLAGFLAPGERTCPRRSEANKLIPPLLPIPAALPYKRTPATWLKVTVPELEENGSFLVKARESTARARA